MTRTKGPHRRPDRGRPDRIDPSRIVHQLGHKPARAALAEMGRDLAYIEFKERMGEPLAASERARLDAARAGSGSGPDGAGGGP